MRLAAQQDLLFGLLALHNAVIDQVQLVDAFQAWTRSKGRALADHFIDRGDLDGDQCQVIEAMVGLHVKKHGGDVEKCLSSISTDRSTRERLACLGDPELTTTLAPLAADSTEAATEHTRTYSLGAVDQHADDPVSRQRFLIEAEITGGLEHPGIVPVYGLGTYDDGRPFYAMRFVKGDSLKKAIEQFHADESALYGEAR
jgi:serine/threonine protein kinase